MGEFTYIHDLKHHLNQYRREPIYAILGEPQSKGRTNIAVSKALLDGGIKVLQYRDKIKSNREKYDECLTIRKLTAEYDATFIVNDSVELALAVEADGIHVGQKDLPLPALQKIVPNWMLIGLSVNTELQLKAAIEDGIAHYIGMGPVFPTTTKKDAEPVVSEKLCSMAIASDAILPPVPIGGINTENIRVLLQRGFTRFAVISALVGAKDIISAAQELREIATAVKK